MNGVGVKRGGVGSSGSRAGAEDVGRERDIPEGVKSVVVKGEALVLSGEACVGREGEDTAGQGEEKNQSVVQGFRRERGADWGSEIGVQGN
jgi:hypothetical protein